MFLPLTPSDARALTQSTPTIIIPFRDNTAQDRAGQLKKFTSHMSRFHPEWPILIIEQSDDDRKFNRGALLNIGARLAESDHLIFHDVDLIPLSPIMPYYTAFPEKPIHIGGAWTTKWQGDSFIGGVMSMSLNDFETINGFPNNFWGWGGEDDSMRNRLKAKQLKVWKPTMKTGFKELEHVDTRSKSEWKNMQKWEDLKADNGKSGVRNVKWSSMGYVELTPNIKKYTVLIK